MWKFFVILSGVCSTSAQAFCLPPQYAMRTPAATAKWLARHADVVLEGTLVDSGDATSRTPQVIEATRVYKGPAKTKFVMKNHHQPDGTYLFNSSEQSVSGVEGQRVLAVLRDTPQGYVVDECTAAVIELPNVAIELRKRFNGVRR